MRFKSIILQLLLLSFGLAASKVHVINSSQEKLELTVSVDPITINDLKPFHILIGLPNNNLPELYIQMYNQDNFENSVNENIDSSVEWLQIQKLRGMWVGTLKITHGINGSNYYKNISISMGFDKSSNSNIIRNDDKILSSRIINWNNAKKWIEKEIRSLAKVSDLPTGQWLKFKIDEDGVYKIIGNSLSNIYSNISISDTRSYMLFTGSNLGRSQSQMPGAPSPTDNLIEIPIQYIGSNNGTFSENDNITFYGKGASGFDNQGLSVTYNNNLYFAENTYWLLIPNDNNLRGKRIAQVQSADSPVVTLPYGIKTMHIENDLINPFESGLGWAEQSISNNGHLEKSFNISNLSSDITPQVIAGFMGGTTDESTRPYPLNTISIGLNTQSDNLGSISWSGLGQRKTTVNIGQFLNEGINTFYFSNISNDGYSQPYFDYLTLHYGQDLIYNGEQFDFFTPIHSNTVSYDIASGYNINIWKITNQLDPIDIALSQSGLVYNFSIFTPTNTHDRLLVFDQNSIPHIADIDFVGQNSFAELRNSNTQVDHIIIAPNEFYNAAEKLISHRGNSLFASLETIYDEFSGGNSDPMAIRNFIDWTQNNWQSPVPPEVFIIGDADYDYRNITDNSNNIVPTIEVGTTGSYATDDRLVTVNGAIPEVAIGRFPAQNIDEANNYIDKLIEFESNPDLGLWRQRVTLIADDGARPEDTPSELNIGKSHTLNSEILSDIIPKEIEKYKLYMMEFPEESNATSFGVAKPEATSTLFDILEKGTAIINYIGHGSAHQWAQERLLFQDRGDLQLINTEMKLPIWIAGTCSWGHFDDIGRESFSEELIRQPNNGASAIITTSRPITVTSNQYYEEQLFNKIFPDGEVSNESIGMILQSIKTGNQEGEYFHLFGDPAMKLPLPTEQVNITSIRPDTLVTLMESTYNAEQNFTQNGGTGFAIINEAERQVTREYNFLSNVESISYKLPGPTMFRGQFSFTDNSINGQFRIPKDISPTSNSTSLKLYATSNDDIPLEGIGVLDSLHVIQGGNTNDEFGPIITFETETGRILRTGDHIEENENILIRLTDPLGINLTGEMGHHIVLSDLIQDTHNNITDDFIYDNNSITTGTIELNQNNMESEIYLGVKAWDSANNPSETDIKLYEIKEAKLKLYNVLNFPNPFNNSTQFTFELSQSAEVKITIFTLGGKKIMEIEANNYGIGFHSIDWNGKDAFGDEIANGVYLYRLAANGDKNKATFIGRIAKYE